MTAPPRGSLKLEDRNIMRSHNQIKRIVPRPIANLLYEKLLYEKEDFRWEIVIQRIFVQKWMKNRLIEKLTKKRNWQNLLNVNATFYPN